MIHKTIAIPEQDLSLFLELIKRFRWKEENQTNTQSIPTWHKTVIDKTLKNLKENPQTAKPWEQLKQELDNENF